LASIFWTEGLIRRIVATVDNLARDTVAPSMWPVKAVEGELQVIPDAGGVLNTCKSSGKALRGTRAANG